MQKTQKDKEGKEQRGTDAIVKGWERNAIFIQAILSFVLWRKIINICNYIALKLKRNITGFYSCDFVKIRILTKDYRYLFWLHY